MVYVRERLFENLNIKRCYSILHDIEVDTPPDLTVVDISSQISIASFFVSVPMLLVDAEGSTPVRFELTLQLQL